MIVYTAGLFTYTWREQGSLAVARTMCFHSPPTPQVM